MSFPLVALRLPDWVDEMLADPDPVYPTVEDRMRLAIDLSRANVRHETGGLSEPRSSTGKPASSSPPA